MEVVVAERHVLLSVSLKTSRNSRESRQICRQSPLEKEKLPNLARQHGTQAPDGEPWLPGASVRPDEVTVCVTLGNVEKTSCSHGSTQPLFSVIFNL